MESTATATTSDGSTTKTTKMVQIMKDVLMIGQSKQQLFGPSCHDTFSAQMVIAAKV
jgi:hypothetical protein